jgi:hypothetical protein
MTDAVHAAGGKIVAQLAHAGHFALEKAIGAAPVVASHFDGLAQTPRTELSVADIVGSENRLCRGRPTGPGPPASTASSCTAPTAICSASFSHPGSTGAPTPTAARRQPRAHSRGDHSGHSTGRGRRLPRSGQNELRGFLGGRSDRCRQHRGGRADGGRRPGCHRAERRPAHRRQDVPQPAQHQHGRKEAYFKEAARPSKKHWTFR